VLEVGDRFPVEKLSVRPEGPAVVYFYPAALTPGCTTEAKAFNDRYQRFRDAGYEVIGVSTDPSGRNDEFRAECGLAFPLVSDEGAELTSSLGLLKDFGEHGTFARRVTYLLDAEGIVRKLWDVTDAAAHPEEVLAEVEG
jgi:thioredoxin-dependent peroxiredoxin